ncbi:MAG: hypothetical protein VYA71_06660, partial [Pseudomonadota bacterium]|nr:hypothetical protein [Pseudomonadota bacterium]
MFTTGLAPRFHRVLDALWIGGAVNTLLPVATVGGEVVKTRILTFDSRNGVHISASVTVDLTVRALNLLLWSMVGIVALVTLGAEGTLAAAAIAGTVLLGLGIAGFVWVQRGAAFGFLARLTPNTGLAETAV